MSLDMFLPLFFSSFKMCTLVTGGQGKSKGDGNALHSAPILPGHPGDVLSVLYINHLQNARSFFLNPSPGCFPREWGDIQGKGVLDS